MRKHYKTLRSAAAAIAKIGDSVVADLVGGVIRQEPDATSQLIGAIKQEFKEFANQGISWKAVVFTDHGPGAEEKRFGADFGGVLHVDLPDYQVRKGFLAQAKLLKKGQVDMRPGELERLKGQCEDMLAITPASFVFVYSHRGIQVYPALSVLSTRRLSDLADLYFAKFSRFYEMHFESFIGDSRLGVPAGDLPALLDGQILVKKRMDVVATENTDVHGGKTEEW